MEYRRFENTCFVRLDKGEEVLAGLLAVCRRENILLATVQGTGTIDDATLTVRYRRTLEKRRSTTGGIWRSPPVPAP